MVVMTPLPQPGEIWYSPRIGYRVKIKSVDLPTRKVYVTDGKVGYTMKLADFEDPGNAWRKLK